MENVHNLHFIWTEQTIEYVYVIWIEMFSHDNDNTNILTYNTCNPTPCPDSHFWLKIQFVILLEMDINNLGHLRNVPWFVCLLFVFCWFVWRD